MTQNPKLSDVETEPAYGKPIKSTVPPNDMHGKVVTFGKHKGELWTRVPVSYLKWLVNESSIHEYRELAMAEIQRRGTTIARDVELSGHAIDRASLRCRKIWHQHCESMGGEEMGIYSWLHTVASGAWDDLKEKPAMGETVQVKYMGLKLVFIAGNFYPTLKSVMPAK